MKYKSLVQLSNHINYYILYILLKLSMPSPKDVFGNLALRAYNILSLLKYNFYI